VHTELLKQAEIRTVEDVVQYVPPVVFRMWIEQRLIGHTVSEQENEAQKCEVHQFYHL